MQSAGASREIARQIGKAEWEWRKRKWKGIYKREEQNETESSVSETGK